MESLVAHKPKMFKAFHYKNHKCAEEAMAFIKKYTTDLCDIKAKFETKNLFERTGRIKYWIGDDTKDSWVHYISRGDWIVVEHGRMSIISNRLFKKLFYVPKGKKD